MNYKKIVELLEEVIKLLPEGVSLAKGGVGELALAHHLGHTVVKGDKGADAMDEKGNLYEYKITTGDTLTFILVPVMIILGLLLLSILMGSPGLIVLNV